jgi:hypothetical protein
MISRVFDFLSELGTQSSSEFRDSFRSTRRFCQSYHHITEALSLSLRILEPFICFVSQ